MSLGRWNRVGSDMTARIAGCYLSWRIGDGVQCSRAGVPAQRVFALEDGEAPTGAAQTSAGTASWPQAPSISLPRVSRTVVGTPFASNRRTNSRSSPRRDAVHLEPGVGLSGMRFTCTHPQSPYDVRPSQSRSVRQGWSLMPRIMAYSMETRRFVA